MPLRCLVVLLAASALDGCVNSKCQGTECPQAYSLVQSCLQAGDCVVDGQPTDCAGNQCPLYVLPPRSVITLPLTWSAFGSRTELRVGAPGADLNTATLLFDDQPATGCLTEQQEGRVRCPAIPSSVSAISFSYSSGQATGFGAVMVDAPCEAAYPPCEL